MKFIKPILAIAIVAFAIASCNQREVITPEPQIDGKLKTNPLCGCAFFDIRNGGSLEVYNEQTAVYFNFKTPNENMISQSIVIGGETFDNIKGGKSAERWIPFNAFYGACGNSYDFVATVYFADGTYEVISGTYYAPCCITCEQFQSETAFGGNTAGGGNAWWFYYKVADGGPQDIYAGQNILIGTVTISGNILTIDFADDDYCGWKLQNVAEPVKIQGYDILPNKRPAAGKFTTYKGNSLVVTLPTPLNTYYVVHLDVQRCTEYPDWCHGWTNCWE